MLTEPGTTGLQWFWPLLISSLAFNLLTVLFGLTAFCCLYSDVVCHPRLKRRRHAKQELYFTAKYGESPRKWDMSNTCWKFRYQNLPTVHQMLQSGGRWSCKENWMSWTQYATQSTDRWKPWSKEGVTIHRAGCGIAVCHVYSLRICDTSALNSRQKKGASKCGLAFAETNFQILWRILW